MTTLFAIQHMTELCFVIQSGNTSYAIYANYGSNI